MKVNLSTFHVLKKLFCTLIFLNFATSVIATETLPQNFWIKCDEATEFLGMKSVTTDALLGEINRDDKRFYVKVPSIAEMYICLDDNEKIGFSSTENSKACGGLYYFNKWNGQLVDLAMSFENCTIQEEAFEKKYE